MRGAFSLFIFLLFVTITSQASNIITGETIQITEQVAGNLYIAGGTVYINAIIEKDLLAVAGEIEINDSIGQDALIGGGEIRFNGVIGDDLRVFGGEIKVLKDILGDLVITGGDVEVASEVTIYGDLIMAGGDIDMRGQVLGKTKIVGGDIDFSGVASGPIAIKAGDLSINGQINEHAQFITESLELKENAQFSADVEYYNGGGEVDFSSKLQEGAQAVYNPDLKSSIQKIDWSGMKRGFFVLMIYWVFASILMIILGIWLFRGFLDQRSFQIRENILNNLGLGLIFFVAIPAAIFVTFITVIGIPVGIILLTTYLLLISLSKVITAIVAAFVVQDEFDKDWSGGQLMLIAIGVYILLRMIGAIPFLGNLINLLVVFIAFGTIIHMLKNRGQAVEEI